MNVLSNNILHVAAATLTVAAVLTSCETDLKEVDRIAAIQAEEPVDISQGVTVVYSDSAKVKARMTAPEMRHYNVKEPYYEFQKGVTIIFFDDIGKETQRITSDYAIQKEVQELTEFRGNVVITRADGSIIKTEELIYDQKANIFYNHVSIEAYFKDGRGNFMGSSFQSDGNFENIEVQNSTGLYIFEEGQGPTFR
ncbi:LPS export ABC transporter periplasmic protein LptC [Parapedobacter sp. ISTM3]|uniref:LPS export ABC transporter protein LptC n=1 Tax=Parapedobacter luteus TaxID=623280 RepID=A0A1T5DN29_9SPHI|nr:MULTISPECIES: LPS export ABC transporter periplasmic protein LptC [Parapedobacter]MBK1440930.1 LPS export ABC transporter periplasmic protein LptC [Parapedobacter sp. ISTM3]SKB72990.1 LPS export ABC transporter protein LptC [Parapedobacter luteus]